MKKAIKLSANLAVILMLLTVFSPTLSADYDMKIKDCVEYDDGGVLMNDLLLNYKEDLIAIVDCIQSYIDIHGSIQGFILPSYLEDRYNDLQSEILDLMVQGFDNFYYSDYWTNSGTTWLDTILDYESSNSFWRRVGDDWEDHTPTNTIRRTWARELVNGDVHELYFGVSVFSPTGATRELVFKQSFPYSGRGDPYLGKKSRGGYCSGQARVDVTLTDGSESTIYVDNPGDLADQLGQINDDIQQIDIYDHGVPGAQWVGDDRLLMPDSDEWRDIADSIADGGTVVLHGCNVADDDEPIMDDYLQDLANEGDVTVTAWTGTTWVVPLPFGNIWFVETGDEVTEEPEEDNPQIEPAGDMDIRDAELYNPTQ